MLLVTPRRVRRRGTASLLSVVPGLGHTYAGDPLAGLGSLVLTGGSTATAVFFSGREQPVLTGVFAGFAGLFWLSGIFEAGAAASRFNHREQERRLALAQVRFWPEAALTEDDDEPLDVSVRPPGE